VEHIRIWQQSRARGICRSCGARIEWAKVVDSGRAIPLDVPVTVANVTQFADGRLIEHLDPTISKSHFATCPQAAQWRKRR
jgi:hypothetical protein